jgi:hypothetical protein
LISNNSFLPGPNVGQGGEFVKEGSIRRDFASISRIKDAGVDLRRLILITDGIARAFG